MAKKKASSFSLDEKRGLILPGDPDFSVEKQCDLMELSRSSYYYTPCLESAFNLGVMKAMDKLYTDHPHYGKRSMSINLKKSGYDVGVDLARTLMRKMGIEAIYQKPNLSKPDLTHKIYPYLLRGVKIERVNQVWSSDITYVPMRNGFLYLTAIIDWYSRYVLAWRLSNSLDGLFCREVLQEALKTAHPEIFNTDQGAQYTCMEFVNILMTLGIQVSMDGRGRALDNVFIERLWRSVKYEDVYLRDYCDGIELHTGLGRYFTFYNTERYHSSHEYNTPVGVYYGKCI
ncbi:MAG: IS3 family transposase [Chlamydiota bacterium]